ncbi:LuxR C-terminal-related transcriptional regulator [Rhizorhabdus wittichii]|uniref:LuxR C-terminal-related transcriptional regulator n=1 Tax=Rhizorhabdus wittichii TaxID=160791 RepID=UPI0002F71489|nr:LuxR C-terminal-related transcriptional regulator [Rhizorhabdus wittichii]
MVKDRPIKQLATDRRTATLQGGSPAPVPVDAGRALRRRLHPPLQRVALCRRDLPLRSLNVARSGKLSILYGPAGYGKTTILAQWRQDLIDQGLPIAWITAAREDGDPQAFLKVLMLALRDAGVDLGEAGLWASGDISAARRLEGAILALERSGKPAVIIVDAFETVNEPSMDAMFADLIEMLPDHVHLVLASRQRPRLTLSTHLARGNVRLIGPDELRFNENEMAQMLGATVTASDLAALSERTGGWPIAVQLHQLWLASAPEGAELSSRRPMAELTQYMADEVLRTLTDAHRDLLTDLSIFPEIETNLADHVRQSEDSALLLEEISDLLPGLIERHGAGIETSYRLHPLIADHAGRQLKTGRGREALLRHRAALWLWNDRRHGEALNQAILGHDNGLLRLFTETLPTLEIFLAHGTDELRAVLRVLPPGSLRQSPRIRLAEALILSKAGLFKDAWKIAEAVAAESAGGDDDPLQETERLTIRSIIASHFMTACSVADMALDRISRIAPTTPLYCAFLDTGRLLTYQQSGDLEAARMALARARAAYDSSGDFPFSHSHLRAHALQIALAEGRLGDASELSHAMLAEHQDSPMAHIWLAMARTALSAVEYCRTYRLRAADQVKMAMVLLGEGDATFDQYAIVLPIILDAAMRRDGADMALQEIAVATKRFAERGLISMTIMMEALVLLYRLRSGSAPRTIDPRQLDLALRPPSASPWRERDSVRHAVALHAISVASPETALSVAQAMLRDGQAGGRVGTRIKALVLTSLAHEREGDGPAADRSMTEALRLAVDESVVAPFAEEGPALHPILERIAREEPTSKLARHLEKILQLINASSHPSQLTDREAEILAHLADGVSNKLIARRLALTENTVKFHLKNIFAKLGVASRKEAAACAFRDL